MARMSKFVVSGLAAFALWAPLASAHSYEPGGAPAVDSHSVANVIDSGAMLRADIDPNANDDWWKFDFFNTSYFFQYGPTAAYGLNSTTAGLYWWQGKTTVTVPVTGLTPGTTYNYRAVAANSAGTTYGPSRTFKTSGKAPSSGDSKPASGGNGNGNGSDKPDSSGKSGNGKSGDGKSGDDGMPDVPGEPALGQSVAAAVSTGTVKVRTAGSNDFHEIADGESIPLNSTFDTTAGTVLIEAADSDGQTYTGAFHGGIFAVHQSSKGKGMTTIEMQGGDFSSCQSNRLGRANASSTHPVLRKLWGKDHGGRFKTSSRGSVATVRGTEWFTADRCDGTLTRVTKGLVLVHERGTGRSKLLHKGDSFFAHVSH
jgi:hypothetical protein